MAGVVYHSGLDNVQSSDVTVTDDVVITDALTVNGNAQLGNATSDLVGFYNGTGISQRASSNQATTNIATSTDFGATQLAVVQEIMNTLAAAGLWKGSA